MRGWFKFHTVLVLKYGSMDHLTCSVRNSKPDSSSCARYYQDTPIPTELKEGTLRLCLEGLELSLTALRNKQQVADLANYIQSSDLQYRIIRAEHSVHLAYFR